MSEKNKKVIVTHSAKFHPDDVFGVATLQMFLEKDGINYQVVRTRDPEIISQADFVVDVGSEYNPDLNHFDHHQEGMAGKRENGIPYASFGLVWKKFGEVVSGNKEIAEKIDQILVQSVDAGDNGVKTFETTIFGVHPYRIGDFLHSVNPTWKEGIEKADTFFQNAVTYARFILQREIQRESDRLEASSIVEDTYKNSKDKRLIIFDRHYPSEDVLNKFPEPLFVVFPKSDDTTWVIKVISDDPETFVNRKSLPKSWSGKRDLELEKITGVAGSIFCHNDCFIAVAKTKEAILALAEIALKS